MTKWADYLVSAVAYDSERQIISLKRHHDNGENIGTGEIIDKASAASDIDNEISYMTIYSTLSNWKLGKKIRSSRVDNHYYLRIDDNKVKHDNLGPLPELSNVLVDEPHKSADKKIYTEKKSHISPDDKKMLKNMGAHQYASIKSVETQSETLTIPKSSQSKHEINSKDLLKEYEKDYLQRIESQNVAKNEERSQSLESPHGTLPKGFDAAQSDDVKSEPEAAPQSLQSPHGTLPKGFDAAQSGDIESEPEAAPQSPHGTLPKGFDAAQSGDIESEPEAAPQSPHGTLPKGFDAAQSGDIESEPEAAPQSLQSPHGTLPKGFDAAQSDDAKSEPEAAPQSPHGTLPKGFDAAQSDDAKSEPEAAPQSLQSPHGTLPKHKKKIPEHNNIEQNKSISDEQTKELIELEKQIGDLKKAVDKLDKSEHSSVKSKKNLKIQAYCVKCKSKRIIKKPTQSKLKNGRPAVRGTCSVCETRVCRIGKL